MPAVTPPPPGAAALIDEALALGADKAAALPVADMVFDKSFRDICATNACGKYGACWMCPPDVGEIAAMMAEAQKRERALVFQTISPLEDSFDYEGMQAAARRHNAVTQAFAAKVLPKLPGAILMGTGGCHVCPRCAKADGEPCRHPQKAHASLETYGVDVSALAKASGLRYVNGQNTVTYFTAVVY